MRVKFACATDDPEVFAKRFRSSPDLTDLPDLPSGTGWIAFDAKVAADVNVFLEPPTQGDPDPWMRGIDVLVYAHQDVFFPAGWVERFTEQWRRAESHHRDRVAVAGVYGVKTLSPDPRKKNVRAGHLLDRGQLLREPAILPREVDSLDECVVAISVASGLRLDPALGWHLWATDLCLQAQERGMVAVAVDAYCEHWSAQSRHYAHLPPEYAASREVFRKKWSRRLPIETPVERIEP